jgi:hypothetical protein
MYNQATLPSANPCRRFPALDWVDLLTPRHRSGKGLIIVVMFVAELRWWPTVLSIVFPPLGTYGVGVFCSCPNIHSGKAVN